MKLNLIARLANASMVTRGLIVGTILCSGSTSAGAQVIKEVPPIVRASLEDRCNQIERRDYTWNILNDALFVQSSIPTDIARRMIEKNLREKHYPEADIPRKIDERMQLLAQQREKYDEDWTFESDGARLRIDGHAVSEAPALLRHEYRQFYADNAIIIEDHDAVLSGGQKVKTEATSVTACPGDCTNYRDSSGDGLDVHPEDMVFLVGRNPLDMYGGKWTRIVQIPIGLELDGDVSSGNYAPYHVHLILDHTKGWAPQSIDLTANGWSEHYAVLSFTQIDKYWLPSVYRGVFDYPRVEKRTRQWTLSSSRPTGGVKIDLPNSNVNLDDFRLIGDDLNSAEYLSALTKPDKNIVHYRWQGRLPTMDELRQIQSHGFLDLSKPAPRSWLTWLSGMLLLGTGGYWVWSTMRRRSNET